MTDLDAGVLLGLSIGLNVGSLFLPVGVISFIMSLAGISALLGYMIGRFGFKKGEKEKHVPM